MLLKTVLIFCLALSALAVPVEKSIIEKGDSSYFLPDNAIVPESYNIIIDVRKSFIEIEKKEFFGEVVIVAKVMKDNLTEIQLHSDYETIEISKINVNDAPASYNKTEKPRDFLRIGPAKHIKLFKGLKITIQITYKGKFQDNLHGFYISEYKENNKKKYALTTQFQPTHARAAFPCFDEPKYKATFNITFKKEKQYLVMSNMKPLEADNGRGFDTVTFPTTPKMSTYLVAFIVSEFEYEKSPYNSDFKVWSRPNARNQTKWAADYVFNITNSLNKFTGINYNDYINKMDMAALSDFSAGAMENWGMLTYRETALLVDDERSTNKDIERVITVIAHEVTHQWFGNLVTCHWWSNTWLNEGFARYFQYFTTADVLPSWEMENQFVVEQQQSVFEVDALAKTTPLTLDVFTPKEISSHFGSISYSKGGSVIRMMKNFIGSEIFQKGLQNYLNKNRLKNTEPNQLWKAIQEVIDEKNVMFEYSLSKIMTTWTSQAGYPVITVNSNNSGYIELSQQRFYINPEENKGKQYWFVPVSYTTSSEMNFTNTIPKLWLTPNESTKTIAVDSDFIIVNVQEAGYYRVNYDLNLWKKIAKALATKDSKVHRLNKAQIVDDVLNLARANLVDYSMAFEVTDYLAFETDYFPWYSTFANFRYLLQRYSDADSTGQELRLYLKDLMTELIKDKKFEEIKNENEIKVLNRVQTLDWACKLDHKDCVSEASELFAKYKKNSGKNIIPKNLRSVVYCTALRHGNTNDWDFLWRKYETSNIAAEKIGILNALGCSSNETILRSYLDKSLNESSGIRTQDASYVFTAVYTGGNSKGVDVAFQFLKEKHGDIENHYGGMNDLEKVTLGLAARLTDTKKMNDFKQLLKSSDDFITFRDAAIEMVDHNMAWAEKHSTIIGSILNTKRNSAAGILANKFIVVFLGIISIYLSISN